MHEAPAQLLVRPALPTEAAHVAWLAATTFPLACPPGAAVEEMARHIATHLTPAAFTAWTASADHTLLVASLGGELLGYALLHLGVPEGAQEARAVAAATGGDGPSVELSKIYAHPLHLGDGTSSALMRATVAAASDLSVAHGHDAPLPLWLGTNSQNLRAQAFYRKHGFVVVGTRTYDVGGHVHDDVVMLHRG
ncbi:GCN5-related N-acetyltransferase [Xylanimonas cellulosilytica DSM 15894]|uniref:GCN5-related N-acetyltransferase n=1 Tax=Xylanimonas cellulosilytica (strain DSM 15894 / JCM 12276 / CECT 5975 / KCTC 9989 / LMG 20990 / NBRC 107835 / XIL07) TaxID=446471 RepID=D1BVU2_XYLCX|nr:GNAT family N-acetyltransferase [Xylanimonas cellulosilytica]ACZ31411.1 GCN5-related N-acetyltransferase [Xylanimonas cellulosilytica DSM 15894]